MDSSDPNCFLKTKIVRPLFSIEILKVEPTEEDKKEKECKVKEGFKYSQDPQKVVEKFQEIFNNLVNDLQKIPSPEKTIMNDLFRK